MDILPIIIILASGAAAGFAIAYFMNKGALGRLEERNRLLEANKAETEQKLDAEVRRANEGERTLATMEADYRNLQEKLQDQKKEVEKLQEQFRTEFKNLANEILEEKSKKFTEQNSENIHQLLKPLGEKIEEFRKRVEDTHREDVKGRSSLEQHLKTLQELNQNMSEEAKNLTKALKGDTKQQGNWGEVILQRILEKSGLIKGREYDIQESHTMDDGRRLQPDVIIRLPDEKHLVVDSKVSLTAYERFVSATDEEEQKSALKQHVTSIRAHVKGLSGKNYQELYAFNSPNFVLMFIPVEPAFAAALQTDSDLFNEAFERNIIIVSPTTLLATLATIENVWKQEYQNKNAMEIATRGGRLYDKFVDFVKDLTGIGQRIDQTQKSYEDAMNKLTSGTGNLVRQAEMLRDLGAKASKQLPAGIDIDSDTADTEEN
jgi:DNA recombination protein RmuC